MTVVDVVRAACDETKGKNEARTKKALSDSYEIILNQARDLVDKRENLGTEAMVEMLGACEENMKLLVRASSERDATFQALTVLPTRITNDTAPADVRKAYAHAVAEVIAAEDEQLFGRHKELAELRKIIADAERASSSGAGPSQPAADDMDLGEDGFAMTQELRSLKCQLTFVPMTEKGENRPMKGPCGHVFSFKGLQQTLKGKKDKCPQAGCQSMVTIGDFVDAKDVVKEIKKAAAAAAAAVEAD